MTTLQCNFEGAISKLTEPVNGGKLRHALSGLLKCDACGRSLVIADARSYACSSFIQGGKHACSNHVRVRRDLLEAAIRDEVNGALDPARIEKHVHDVVARVRRHAQGSVSIRETAEKAKALEDRISRLRRRLHEGDPDLDTDELQAAIAAAEAKRAKLTAPALKPPSVSFLATLPKASARLCGQIQKGFDTDDVAAAARAREILRRMFGTIRLRVDAEGLWAESQIGAEPLKLLATDQTHISVVGVKGFEPSTPTSRTIIPTLPAYSPASFSTSHIFAPIPLQIRSNVSRVTFCSPRSMAL